MSVVATSMDAEPSADFDIDDAERYEVVDGIRVELPPMSAEASVLASRLATRLSVQAMGVGAGEAYSETLFELPLPYQRNRRPDLAFVPYSRWPAGRRIPRDNAWKVLPALVGEIVSPSDFAEDLLNKVHEYFAAGVQIVWVIYPQQQVVYVYTSPTALQILSRADRLTVEPIVAGFSLPLSEVFPDPETSS